MVPSILNNTQTNTANTVAAAAASFPNSTFVLLDSQLLGNAAAGAGGGAFVTSTFGVILRCTMTTSLLIGLCAYDT